MSLLLVRSLCLVRYLLVSCPIIYSYCCTFRASVVSTAFDIICCCFLHMVFNWLNRWFICHIIRNWFISCCYWHCHMIFVPSRYVTVTGTFTVPGTSPFGKLPGLSAVTVVPSGASVVSTAPLISSVVVSSPYGFQLA